MIMDNIVNCILKSNRIAITFHISPDGDSLGSSLALLQGLKKLSKDAYILSSEGVPEVYSFLPGVEECNRKVETLQPDTDCVIVLDCGDVDRIAGQMDVNQKSYLLINIDHHVSNDLYGDLNYVDTKASAMGEIVYEMLNLMDIALDKEMSICLYTSIVADTGGFKYSNTTATTHKIAGELINRGIDFNSIHRAIFENKKFERVKLYGKVIDTMTLLCERRLCVMEMHKSMLEALGMEASDTSDVVALGTELQGVEVTLLLKEVENGVKASLRSKSVVDVRKVAELFGGGGHIRASGVAMNTSLADAKQKIIEALEKELR